MELENKNDIIRSDVEIEHEDLSLESFDEILSEQEELLVAQIDELQKQIDDSHDLMFDLMEATKKGAIDYVDAMTDTGDTFSKAKDPYAVKSLNDIEIDKRSKPADVESNANWQTRKMSDAKSNPFDRNVLENTNGMSVAGKAKFEKYKEAYNQRLKTNTITSNGKDNSIKTSDSIQNFESLSGLRNYRVGPIIPMPDIETIKEGYKTAVAEGKTYSASGYIRKQNFDAFDDALMDKFGFSSRTEAKQWRKSNHLTIHETGDGMYLVPTDVHDSASHKGYCSKLADILKGKEGAENAMEQYIRDEKIAYVKHEAKIRGWRAAKGTGMAAAKDLMKHVIVNLVTSFYKERKQIKEQGLLNYVKTVLSTCWKKVKTKAINMIKSIVGGAIGAIGTELLNAINDFFTGTFKRLFSVIRQMFGSIKNAFRILCSKEYSWQEKVFEAAKVLSAGAVAILGFSLNEIIEKGLLHIPGMPVSIASFIAECLAGLSAGIFSNIVLMLFDHTKASLKVRDAQLQLSLHRSQSIFIDNLRIDVAVLKSSRDVCGTYQFFGNVVGEIKNTRDNIIATKKRINETNIRTAKLLSESNSVVKLLKEIGNDEDF